MEIPSPPASSPGAARLPAVLPAVEEARAGEGRAQRPDGKYPPLGVNSGFTPGFSHLPVRGLGNRPFGHCSSLQTPVPAADETVG